MIVWIDAYLSPHLAPWLQSRFGVAAASVRFLGLRDAKDREIVESAREAGAVVLTKDQDFVHLQERFGAPPQIVWLTCGNTSNTHLRQIFAEHFECVFELLRAGEVLVEIGEGG